MVFQEFWCQVVRGGGGSYGSEHASEETGLGYFFQTPPQRHYIIMVNPSPVRTGTPLPLLQTLLQW